MQIFLKGVLELSASLRHTRVGFNRSATTMATVNTATAHHHRDGDEDTAAGPCVCLEGWRFFSSFRDAS